MKNSVEVLSQYKSVHFNKTNIATHFIGVPLIVWALTLLLSLPSFELFKTQLTVTPALVLLILSLIYYFILDLKLAFGMLFYVGLNLFLASFVVDYEYAIELGITVFIIGWAFQFIGHYYEKAKPAFVDDLLQFIIGPLFLMAEIYFYLGWCKTLKQTITPLAVAKRRKIDNKE